MLDEIPETDEIELHINSNGGSVAEGTAIYNLLKQHSSKKTGIVDGVCHSVHLPYYRRATQNHGEMEQVQCHVYGHA